MEQPSIRQQLSLELLTAADKGDARKITQLLKRGADPAIQDGKRKKYPLILATLKGHIPSGPGTFNPHDATNGKYSKWRGSSGPTACYCQWRC